MSSIEKTLSIIKPDAVERNLTDDIKKKFLENNLKIIKSKKKFRSIKMRLQNFTKSINQNLFTIDYVVICRQDQLWL